MFFELSLLADDDYCGDDNNETEMEGGEGVKGWEEGVKGGAGQVEPQVSTRPPRGTGSQPRQSPSMPPSGSKLPGRLPINSQSTPGKLPAIFIKLSGGKG